MGQLYGRTKDVDGTTSWKPIAAIPQPDGTFHLAIDSELTVDAGNLNLSNLKIASKDQTSANLRYLKVLDDGILISVSTPLELFEIADVDQAGTVRYYGYSDDLENWYIMKEDKSVVPNTYRYFKGSGNYALAFANRATHTYDFYHNIF